MLVGHFAAGFAAKRIEPKVSLGTYVLAAMLPDLLWCLFLLAGIERVQYGSGRGAANYLQSWNVALSHSLLVDAIWAALFATAYFLVRHYRRGAWVLFAVVLSHWFLDFISNKDMPIAPGLSEHAGLGLWRSLPWTLVVEGGFWLLALIVYLRATIATRRAGVYVFWIGVALLTLIWYGNIAGAPPPNPRAAPIFSLILFSGFVLWAYWMNRTRRSRRDKSFLKTG